MHPDDPKNVERRAQRGDLDGPRASPRAQYPNVEDEPEEPEQRSITGVYRLVDDQRKRWTGIAVFVGVIGAGLLAIAGVARAQTDAGVKNTNIRVEQQEQALKNHIEDEHEKQQYVLKRVDHQDDAIAVVNKKMDLVLDRLHVDAEKRPAEVGPPPPRPPEKDGGR